MANNHLNTAYSRLFCQICFHVVFHHWWIEFSHILTNQKHLAKRCFHISEPFTRIIVSSIHLYITAQYFLQRPFYILTFFSSYSIRFDHFAMYRFTDKLSILCIYINAIGTSIWKGLILFAPKLQLDFPSLSVMILFCSNNMWN